MHNELGRGIEFAGRPPTGIYICQKFTCHPKIPSTNNQAPLSNATGSPIKNATVIIEVDPARSSITVLLARISYYSVQSN